MTRYREINTVDMTPAQKEVHDEIVAGRRGRFGGPFQILIRAPEVCRHLQRLGEYLRWGSSLPPALSELAICLTARHLAGCGKNRLTERFVGLQCEMLA